MALASHLFSGRQRAAALGLEGAATYVGMAIGPAYGAWVLLNFTLPIPRLDMASWQWIFLLNVPIGIVMLLLIYVVAGGIETPRVRGRPRPRRGGAADASRSSPASAPSPSPARPAGPIRSSWAGSRWRVVALRRLRLATSSGSRSPLVDLRLFADRAFSAANSSAC